MKIEKVKNYNQIMLSIIVTAGVAFAVIGLIAFILFIAEETFHLFDHRTNSQATDYSSVPVNNNVDAKEDGKLIVSCSFPELVDSASQIYLIPVGFKNSYELQDEYSKTTSVSKGRSSGTRDYNSYSNFANFVIFDAKSDKSETLFKRNVLIQQYWQEDFKDDILLIFEGADNDSDKDGKITASDQTSYFVYSVKGKLLKQIKYDDKNALNFEFVAGTKDMIIGFGKNESSSDKKDVDKPNSVVICKYNYQTDKLIVLNNDKLIKEIQAIRGK